MPYSSTAEMYFIIAMMFLILVICTVACFFFFRTYQREKTAKAEAARLKAEQKESVELSKAE
ncbi:MAG: hypothetical protein ACR2GD_02680 [Pyrinomonadaceae bacterium]